MIKKSIQTLKIIPFSIWAIGVSGFLLNISSVIVFGLTALYLKHSLGATLAIISILEASVEAFATLTKLFSGIFSDYLRKRKILMLWGFAMATVARPILAIFPSVYAVIAARFLDRLGNGIQSAPRDALVGDLAPEGYRGACFGLRQTWAQAGSCVGGGVSWWLMTHSNDDYIFAFWMASIPALLGFIILWIFVKEPKPIESGEIEIVGNRHPLHLRDVKRLGGYFWGLMVIVFVFYLARLSENFLLLHANANFSYSVAQAQIILMFYNGFNSLISYPVGSISDRIPRTWFLGIGIVTLILANICLAYGESEFIMLLGVSLWGIQIGVTQSMFIAIIADRIPADLRGTGIGCFYLIMAISLLVCGKFAAVVHDYLNHSLRAVFMYSGAVGVLALLASLVFFKKAPTK